MNDFDELQEQFKNDPVVYSGIKTLEWLKQTHNADKKLIELIEYLHGWLM